MDDQIDRLAATSDAERLELLELHEFVLNTLSAAPFVYSGRMGAYLQGAPVPVSVIELAIADADLDSFGEALEKLCTVRWDERWGFYCDPLVNPRRRRRGGHEPGA